MENYIEGPGSSEPNPEKEKMIDAVKITTVFSDEKVLQSIADTLLSQGVISGFHIDRVLSGYVYGGKKVEEAQYALEILLETSAHDSVKQKINETITNTIKEYWDVPIIEEENVRINENLLGFIESAESEHKKYEKEKKLRLSISLAALVSIAGILGTLVEQYADRKEQRAIAAERANAYQKISQLQQDVQKQVEVLEHKLANGEKLTILPNEYEESYKETEDILKSVREAEFEVYKLKEGK